MNLFLDIETYSRLPIAVGSDVYSTDPSTGVHCLVFGWDESGVRRTYRWNPPHPDDAPGLSAFAPPDELAAMLPAARLVAHNVSFEFAIWQNVLHRRYGWPAADSVDRWVDTRQLAALCNLPQGLGELAATLGLPMQKDEEGQRLMLTLCTVTEVDHVYHVPRPTPAQLHRLTDYCEQDVLVTMAAFDRLVKMRGVTAHEVAVMAADREVNARGVCVDRTLAARITQVARLCDAEISRAVFGITNDSLGIGAPALKTWLQGQGIKLPHRRAKKGETAEETPVTADKRAVATWLADPATPPHVRALLEQRVQAGKVTSLGKLKRLPSMLGNDHRLRWMLSYCGAHTGRWASYGVQLHNLPKPRLKARESAFRSAVRALDLDTARGVEPNLMQGLSWLLRSLFVAPPGSDLIGADYSAIEARVLAWLAGQDDVLDTFRRGADVYLADAAAIGTTDRDLGKVCRLGLGYGMGALTLLRTAADRGVGLLAKDAARVHRLWRTSNPRIAAFWPALLTAVLTVVREGVKVRVGPHLTVARDQQALLLVLPSGRVLRYWRPAVHTAVRRVEVLDEDGVARAKDIETTELQFFRPQKGTMVRDSTYGGKLAENVTQAVARDLLAAAVVRLRETTYRTVLHVHDSIVAEVAAGTGTVEQFEDLVCRLPTWAGGLPMKADGYRSPWFRG
jgi:DNA polymerase